MSEQPGPPAEPAKPHHQSFWLWVMCLTGVDYFSTLGYQPSIAYENAGLLAPFATVILVLVTLFGALPIYWYVCGRSHTGQGSIGMLARLVSGWPGKILVLVLLGFAATDFVITKTLSSADAAVHLIQNPHWPAQPQDDAEKTKQAIYVTSFMLVLLGASFMRGFREVIGLAVVIVFVYLVLSAIVVGAGVLHIMEHPETFSAWIRQVESGNWHLKETPLSGSGWLTVAAISLIIFPKLALGLSGFETGVAVMPLVKGKTGDDPAEPKGRIRNTRKLLLTAALVMSVFLIGSSVVVACLVPPEQLTKADASGHDRPGIEDKQLKAKDRALAYIAHGENPDGKLLPFFGDWFGTIYDLSTVIISGSQSQCDGCCQSRTSASAALWHGSPNGLRMTRLLVLLSPYKPRGHRHLQPVWKAEWPMRRGARSDHMRASHRSSTCGNAAKEDGTPDFVLSLFITFVFVYTTIAKRVRKPDGIKLPPLSSRYCYVLLVAGRGAAS